MPSRPREPLNNSGSFCYMSETQFLASVGQYGPWVTIILLISYIVSTKLGPQALKSFFDERKAQRQEQINVYDKFIVAYAENTKYIASNTRAIEAMNENTTRALDANTQQLYRLTHAIEGLDRAGGVK